MVWGTLVAAAGSMLRSTGRAGAEAMLGYHQVRLCCFGDTAALSFLQKQARLSVPQLFVQLLDI